MAEIEPKNWLEWYGGRKAQQHAIRLSLYCSSILPSDNKLKKLVQNEVIHELLELALHGRRTMELFNKKSATIGDDPFWPASQILKTDLNLFGAFGAIVHAREIKLNWEEPQMTPNPYNGRKAIFAATVTVKSDRNEHTLPIGAIAAAYIGFENEFMREEQKGKA